MLACLVIIPLVAIFGKSLPDVFDSLLEGRWPTWPASQDRAAEQPPQFRPAATAGAAAVSPLGDTPPGGWAAGQAIQSPRGSTATGPPSAVVPASYAPQIDAGPSRAGATPGPGRLSADVSAPRAVPVPAAFPAGGASVGQPPQRIEGFTHIQDRLRQLGATYYLLESWGSREQLYRFYCKVAVGGNPDYTRYFETSDSDPVRAMREVLRQVEAWRVGGP